MTRKRREGKIESKTGSELHNREGMGMGAGASGSGRGAESNTTHTQGESEGLYMAFLDLASAEPGRPMKPGFDFFSAGLRICAHK